MLLETELEEVTAPVTGAGVKVFLKPVTGVEAVTLMVGISGRVTVGCGRELV